MTFLAQQTAECNHCGRRCSLRVTDATLWFHKTPDRNPCPGTATTDHHDIRVKRKDPGRRRPYQFPPELLEIEPPTIKVRPPGLLEITSRKSFREFPYENWLNRWERKFGVKIPDENVKVLTSGKCVRRSEK